MTHTLRQGAPLYNRAFEHDGCGVGFVADLSGRPSHAIVEKAIEAVVNLTHRGAVDADAKTGDGAGILTQIPHGLIARSVEELGYPALGPGEVAVGMIFFPRDDRIAQERCRTVVEDVLEDASDLHFFGWRPVPVDPSVLGDKALETQPRIEQVLIDRPAGMDDEAFERALYLARRRIERRAARAGIEGFYIASLSHRTIVYKGLLVAPQLREFYLDLQDPAYETALAVFHQRYSTNTFPDWILAQPFRLSAHNGEINTLWGNTNWMRAREPELASDLWGDQVRRLLPIIQSGGSDSACLDNVLEAVVQSGRDPLHAMMMLIPEAWENMPDMDPVLRGFYEYHACLTEPWDGPAAVAFSDGRFAGATLDRNGLRPARYIITTDGLIVMGSEVGMLDIAPGKVAEKGRLGPGQMIAVDTVEKRLWRNDEIKCTYAERRPYRAWVSQHLRLAERPPSGGGADGDRSNGPGLSLIQKQRAFGYVSEDLQRILGPMVLDGKEPVGSMGDDTPLSVLSQKPRLLYTYFKQRFAQVTNPPIDPLREELVMSLMTLLGQRKNLFEEAPEHAHLIAFPSPVLTDEEVAWLRELEDPAFECRTLACRFPAAEGPKGLKPAVERLCEDAIGAAKEGAALLILSDRGVDAERAPIPMLLAVGAVHHALIRAGVRISASLVAETGEVREVHHFACLLGYGASAINPYLAWESVPAFCEVAEGLTPSGARANYRAAVDAGILKIMSKMGISTVSSYQGAQIFEAIGLDGSVVDRYFTGTPCHVEGADLTSLASDVLACHAEAFGREVLADLPDAGFYRYRTGGEYHAFNPAVFRNLHKAVRTGRYEDYQAFVKAVHDRPPMALRDLLEFVRTRPPVPIDEVEPIESIRKRFTVSGMSHGALSREAHETLAIAMNRIGAKSNSGEGGEDPERYHVQPGGDWPNSAVKQVASGRFGVTPEYLASAHVLEIKMAQGSKPGEGGQLPGHKVSAEIAYIRHSVPGVTLISPPPHHDIYSIEDLAQLIYDLKQANPRARVCVKLVAEAGVGTIAAGVAKGYADVILISGHDGGTGASPLSSIKSAGSPWELGLAETQQILVQNDLRGRVLLRTDGGLKTGRDVVVAAMLGAEEYGFGTSPVVSIGCVMARQCHLNTCPVGVATQDPKLRARFRGSPEMAVHYFTFVAQEVRDILAGLGVRSMDEIIGHADMLRPVPEVHAGKKPVDLSAILAVPEPSDRRPRRRIRERNDRVDFPLDDTIRQDAHEVIQGKLARVALRYPIRNIHRAVGARLAGEIAFNHGDEGLPDGAIECHFEGSAGQSFGAFCIRGLRLVLEGEANDYVGKGMAGGEIIIRPPREASFPTHLNTIIGNTVMYGATGGILYAAGRGGERFCVRNSGGHAIIEGLGDHGCEYMTGGIVVVLGEVGRNFGAGMTGGLAYVLDETGVFEGRYNLQLVDIERLSDPEDIALVRKMVASHAEMTESPRALELLGRWEEVVERFWKVVPKESPEGTRPQLKGTSGIVRQHEPVPAPSGGKNGG